MLVAVLTVLVLFIFVQIISFISWRDMKRRRKSYIREKFGRIPKAGEWNENRKDFCSLFLEEISVDAAQKERDGSGGARIVRKAGGSL